MALVPISLPPGMFRNGTNYQSLGRWYDGNLVRFFEGTIRPVGGWIRTANSTVTGLARAMHSWRAFNSDRWCGIGTHSNLFVYNGGSLYDITPSGFTSGRADSAAGNGYGTGPYGTGNYGVRPTITTILDATTWTLDNWGQYLLGCSSTDGKIYEWQLDILTPAAAITGDSGLPVNNRGIIVTAERYLMAFGAGGNPRLLQWCDQEDFSVWTPLATNTAGDIELQTQGTILAMRRGRGILLAWTETEVFSVDYLGAPLVYGTTKLASAAGVIGANAAVITDAGAFWMSQNSFFIYNGTVTPIDCDVFDYVFGSLNTIQSAKIFAGHNSQFGEVFWFYPSAASNEPDRYVIYNYREGHWTTGGLARGCWEDRGVFPYPLAMDSSGNIYQHEYGWTNNGTPITSQRYLTAGPMEVTPGNNVIQVNQIIADEAANGQVQMTFTTQFTPEGQVYSFGPYAMTAYYTDVRFTGRQFAPTLQALVDADWRIGKFRMDIKTGGGR